MKRFKLLGSLLIALGLGSILSGCAPTGEFVHTTAVTSWHYRLVDIDANGNAVNDSIQCTEQIPMHWYVAKNGEVYMLKINGINTKNESTYTPLKAIATLESGVITTEDGAIHFYSGDFDIWHNQKLAEKKAVVPND